MRTETIELEVKTKGLERTRELLNEVGDALDALPSQVNFRHVENCTINIYPSQHVTYCNEKEQEHDE